MTQNGLGGEFAMFARLAFVVAVGMALILGPTAVAASEPNRWTQPQVTSPDEFNPDVNGTVWALAIQVDGKVLLAGDFEKVSGQTRSNIARVNSDGSLDTTFNADVDGPIQDVVQQSNGQILIGGEFTEVNGEPRERVARLDVDGSLDPSFQPAVDDDVRDLVIQADGKIILAGDFNTVEGQARNALARLNSDGSVDTTFSPRISLLGNSSLGQVNTVLEVADDKMVIGGAFDEVDGQNLTNLARLNADGSVDVTFRAGGWSGPLNTLAVQSDGKVLVGGFGGPLPLEGPKRENLARLNADGSLDISFKADTSGPVAALAIQGDGAIIVGGSFEILGGQAQNNLARLKDDGTVDSAFAPNPSIRTDGKFGLVSTIQIQVDQEVLIGGQFKWVGGQARNNVARVATESSPTTITNVVKPVITGTPRAGRVLKASSGTWSVSPDQVSYAWTVGGKVIGERASIKVPRTARGKAILLKVTASKPGYLPGSVVVKVRVKAR